MANTSKNKSDRPATLPDGSALRRSRRSRKRSYRAYGSPPAYAHAGGATAAGDVHATASGDGLRGVPEHLQPERRRPPWREGAAEDSAR